MADNIDTSRPDLTPTSPDDILRVGRSNRVSACSLVLIAVLTLFFLAVFFGASYLYGAKGGIADLFPTATPNVFVEKGHARRLEVSNVQVVRGQEDQRDVTVFLTMTLTDEPALLLKPVLNIAGVEEEKADEPASKRAIQNAQLYAEFSYTETIKYTDRQTKEQKEQSYARTSIAPINVDAIPLGGSVTITDTISGQVDKRWDGRPPRISVRYVNDGEVGK